MLNGRQGWRRRRCLLPERTQAPKQRCSEWYLTAQLEGRYSAEQPCRGASESAAESASQFERRVTNRLRERDYLDTEAMPRRLRLSLRLQWRRQEDGAAKPDKEWYLRPTNSGPQSGG